MQVYSTIRQRIKERVIAHQERQKEVFNISFIIFATIYINLLIFIQASFKFIKVIAIRPVKGMSGILKLFYNNNKDIRKGEGSKQPIDL